MSDHEALRRWATELRSVLLRGGDHLNGEVLMSEVEGGRFAVTLRLRRPLTGPARAAVRQLIREHAAAFSWRVVKARFFCTHAALEVTARPPGS